MTAEPEETSTFRDIGTDTCLPDLEPAEAVTWFDLFNVNTDELLHTDHALACEHKLWWL